MFMIFSSRTAVVSVEDTHRWFLNILDDAIGKLPDMRLTKDEISSDRWTVCISFYTQIQNENIYFIQFGVLRV